MKIRFIATLTAIIIAFGILVTILLIQMRPQTKENIVTTTPAASLPIDNPTEIYLNATDTMHKHKDISFKVFLKDEITVGGSTFTESSEKTITIVEKESPNLCILVDSSVQSSTHNYSTSELYSNGTVYFSVNDSLFKSQCNEDAFLSEMIPAVLLDAKKYNSISGVDTRENYIVKFQDAICIEDWVSTDDVTLISAEGSSVIQYDGTISESTYCASYLYKGIEHSVTVTTKPSVNSTQITLPENVSDYIPITYRSAPYMLEKVSGYLMQARCVSSSYTDCIYFTAIGDKREQNTQLHVSNTDNWSALIKNRIILQNDSKQDQTTVQEKDELFWDNRYSVSFDQNQFLENGDITQETMHNYIKNQLISTIMLPQYIATADVRTNENSTKIIFTGNDAFIAYLVQNACNILYQDPGMIPNISSNIVTDQIFCYLEVDNTSGLPLSSGILFSGNYYAEDLPYQLLYQADQHYQLPSTIAHSEIAKTAGE